MRAIAYGYLLSTNNQVCLVALRPHQLERHVQVCMALKIVEVIMKTLFEGARIVADSTTHAVFHASLNARVSSEEPSPTAPQEVTSKMQFDVSPGSFGYGYFVGTFSFLFLVVMISCIYVA